MPKLQILPDIQDVELFKCAGQNKSNNADYNKIRENIIANMYYLDDDYFLDPVYGSNWRSLREKFTVTVSHLCKQSYSVISIKQLGGMSHNYDFLLSFTDESKNRVKEIKLEFKHNNSDVKDLVQFLELYDKDVKDKFELCEVSYAEFYYDNYLDKYLECDPNLATILKPTKEEYLKNVYDIQYSYPFFAKLYEHKTSEMKKKKDISNQSVKEYLELYSSTFKFDKITEKIRASQSEKVFLMWDCENFHTQTLDIENITISGIKKIDNLYFDVSVDNFEYNIRVRLNWGNNNGLANPRWKFTFITI
uniref:Uncharacterized protein n=1 Tax=viral metagenome TaxID=1070528 RepID=A0A6C0AS36_9ZZZZ